MRTIFFNVILISCILALKGELLHYVNDEIIGGSYKYYNLMYDGTIKIHLKSEVGDADLYASQIFSKPTYEPDSHCVQSTTCGEDIILIPESFKRPVSIGVYGHPSFEISQYSLFVYELPVDDHISPEEKLQDTEQESNIWKQIITFITSVLWNILGFCLELLVLNLM